MSSYSRIAGAAVWAATLSAATLSGQDTSGGIRLGDEQTLRWKVGVEVKATGMLTGGQATMCVPTDWPEQTVRIVGEDISKQARKPTFRKLDGAKQMIVQFPHLAAGEEAHAYVIFEVVKKEIDAPESTDDLQPPAKISKDLTAYMGVSPYIETNDPQIKARSKEAVGESQTGWTKTEAIYDWVRERVQYKFDPKIKPAKDALRDGIGDCEELTSLFVAFCRNQGIPARSVWVPGHTYPEFYLVDGGGRGHWIPCQAAGDRSFGRMHEDRPILQKGDSFKVPDERQPLRYVQSTFKAANAAADPAVKFVFEKATTDSY